MNGKLPNQSPTDNLLSGSIPFSMMDGALRRGVPWKAKVSGAMDWEAEPMID